MTDVSVIIAVHNTAPYLAACLDSVLGQTLLRTTSGSVEVIAIDDGSSDGSETMLDQYAGRHPDIFRIDHGPASGSPAGPRNRALELAQGRYVFFLDSDDHLSDFALERLVAAADEWESDIVLGRQVGSGGRGVYQGIYRETCREIDLTDPRLAYTLSVTKLFRRSLIIEQRLRFPELRIGSDQPFAVAAMVAARRISVLADAPYYFLRRREDLSNITYSVPWRPRLADLTRMIVASAAAVPDGPARDNVLCRAFDWEFTTLIRANWSGLRTEEKHELLDGVGSLADAYLTEDVLQRLRPERRLVQWLAQARSVHLLDELLATEAAGTHPTLVLRRDHAYLALPGFGELPDDLFELIDPSTGWHPLQLIRAAKVSWQGRRLVVTGLARIRADADPPLELVLVPVKRAMLEVPARSRHRPPAATASGPVALTMLRGDSEAELSAHVDATALLRSPARPRQAWEVRVRMVVRGRTVDVPLTDVQGGRTRARLGARFFELHAHPTKSGGLSVRRARVPLRTVLAELLRR